MASVHAKVGGEHRESRKLPEVLSVRAHGSGGGVRVCGAAALSVAMMGIGRSPFATSNRGVESQSDGAKHRANTFRSFHLQ